MANIVDYVENELRPFDKLPFSSVDSLILAQFSYLNFEGLLSAPDLSAAWLPLRELYRAEIFPALLHEVYEPRRNRRLLAALAASPRFRDLELNFYASRFDSEKEEQFAALSIRLPDNAIYIAFRGTDSTFVGWKEDFNMAFISPVPAQLEARRYTEAVAALTDGPLLLGGHSKGGNLAVYAAFSCCDSIRSRIRRIYSHDGPGFKEGVLDGEGYQAIRDRVEKTLPRASLVGMLLEQQEQYQVVESSGFWVMQHDPFLWEVEGHDFRYVPELSGGARYFNRSFNEWIAQMTEQERARFTDSLFEILGSGEARTVTEFSANWLSESHAIANAVKHLDPETRRFLLQIAKELAAIYVHNAEAAVKERARREAPPLALSLPKPLHRSNKTEAGR